MALSFNVSSIFRLNTELFYVKIMTLTDATAFLQKYFTFFLLGQLDGTDLSPREIMEIMRNYAKLKLYLCSFYYYPQPLVFLTWVPGIFLIVTNSNFCSTRLQKNFILPFSGFPEREKSNRPRFF